MILKNKYVVGVLVQFYEIGMFEEYIRSCKQMLDCVENRENITFHFCLNFQEHFEKIDWNAIQEVYKDYHNLSDKDVSYFLFKDKFRYMFVLQELGSKVVVQTKRREPNFYSIADYRRDLCDKWCDKVDYVLWGETDSMFPSQTFMLMEYLHEMVAADTPKFVANFAGRKNWDSTWDIITHPIFKKVQYIDTNEWILNNEASEKSYMSLDRMNEINDIPLSEVEIVELLEPKADGSCLIISSELIRSGVNIPKSLILCGEDESFLQMAKIVMGSEFSQFHFNNILRVHNRRHPNKRTFILNEENPRGFCDERKGDWWKKLELASKYNLANLRNQKKSIRIDNAL